jgi:aminotransferase
MDIKQAAIDAILNDKNQYSITWGSKNLRNALSQKVKAYNKIEADPEKNIVVTCGSTEAMMSAMKAIVNPGDEVIIFEPFYENYGPDCILSGAKPRYIRLTPPEWNYDSEKLKSLFNSKTKAIIINTPNNPTGKVFSKEELQEIADLCIDHDCIAITDEIYEHILYNGKKHISIASLPGMEERTITINSISKTYSLTGWRVGWAIASEKITKEVKKVHDFLTVGAAHPLQEAAAYCLTLGEEYYKELADFYTEAKNSLYGGLSETCLKPYNPNGAYYIMCDASEYQSKFGLKTSLEVSIDLLKRVGIATVPGNAFFSKAEDGKSLIRFCFCKKPETLDKAKDFLKKIASA